MRKHTCQPFGEEVDLDNPDTYSHLSDNIDNVRNKIFEEIGYSYCYMNYWHKDVYSTWEGAIKQKNKVEEFVKNFTINSKDNWDNLLWHKEQLFLLQDEIENMC